MQCQGHQRAGGGAGGSTGGLTWRAQGELRAAEPWQGTPKPLIQAPASHQPTGAMSHLQPGRDPLSSGDAPKPRPPCSPPT